jgi:hypothetical protein
MAIAKSMHPPMKMRTRHAQTDNRAKAHYQQN